MFGRWLGPGVAVLLAVLGTGFRSQGVQAEETATAPTTLAAVTPTAALRPNVAAPRPPAPHPLEWVLKFAHEEQIYLQRTVHAFTCRVTKRERIEGELQDHRYIDMWVRERTHANPRATQPPSVLLEFLGPSEIEGRKVLFVAGQNDNRLLVRKGGRRFGYVVTDLDPESSVVKQESLMPITEIGFSQVLDRTIRALEQDLAADPRGDNTIVEHITGGAANWRRARDYRVSTLKLCSSWPGISAEPLCGGAANWRLAWDHRVSTLKLCSSCTSNFGAWAGSVARTIAGRRS